MQVGSLNVTGAPAYFAFTPAKYNLLRNSVDLFLPQISTQAFFIEQYSVLLVKVLTQSEFLNKLCYQTKNAALCSCGIFR